MLMSKVQIRQKIRRPTSSFQLVRSTLLFFEKKEILIIHSNFGKSLHSRQKEAPRNCIDVANSLLKIRIGIISWMKNSIQNNAVKQLISQNADFFPDRSYSVPILHASNDSAITTGTHKIDKLFNSVFTKHDIWVRYDKAIIIKMFLNIPNTCIVSVAVTAIKAGANNMNFIRLQLTQCRKRIIS